MARLNKHPIRDWFAILAAELALDRRQWAGVAAAAVVLVVLGVCFVGLIRGKTFPNSNWGFGPEWDCGDPMLARYLFCIRKPPPKPN